MNSSPSNMKWPKSMKKLVNNNVEKEMEVVKELIEMSNALRKENNVKISASHIGRVIKQDEIKYKNKRSKMFSNDKNFLKNI